MAELTAAVPGRLCGALTQYRINWINRITSGPPPLYWRSKDTTGGLAPAGGCLLLRGNFGAQRTVALWMVVHYTGPSPRRFYLGFFDRHVKERLRLPGYVRYMDDVALWSADRDRLEESLRSSAA